MCQSSNPLVSIIVITYNSAKYVLETLESAKNQSYQNIELIISDDASQDNTVSICEDWLTENKDRFVRSKIITVDKNTGIPANCNRGVKLANGDWIKFIAGDDQLLKTCIADNIKYCNLNKDVQIVQTNVNYFLDYFKEENLIKNSSLNELYFFSEIITANEQYKIILKGNKILAPSIFINKSLYDLVGQYDERIPLIEDWPFWTKILKAGIKIHFYDKTTVNYRKFSEGQNKGSRLHIMSKQYASNLLLYIKLYKKGNVSWLHYNLYKISLIATIYYYLIGMNGKSKILDKIYFSFLSKIRKF